MTKKKHILNFMLDIETLDTGPTAAVVSFAMVYFERDRAYDACYQVLNLRQQLAKGRTMSLDTVEWWLTEAYGMYPKKDLPRHDVPKAIQNLASYMDSYIRPMQITYPEPQYETKIVIWAKPPSFDLVIFENLAAQFNVKGILPWKYDAPRDVRSVQDYLDDADWDAIGENTQKHDPVADVLHQIKVVQQFWKRMK